MGERKEERKVRKGEREGERKGKVKEQYIVHCNKNPLEILG